MAPRRDRLDFIYEVNAMNTAQYATTIVPPAQRFEYWKEVVCRHCIPAASQPLMENDFDGELSVRTLGVLDICTLSAPLHRWDRTAAHLRSGPDDDLWLGFSRHGHGQLEQGGRQAVLGADRLFLYDASQPFRFSIGGENHLIRIPRYLLSAQLPGVENLTAQVLDESRPGLIPLREMLRQVVSEKRDLPNAALSERLSRTLLDLLVLSVELQGVKTAGIERDLYARIMNYIARHLTEPELTIERIAQAHHVSTRTVTRAFARHQKTPMSAIWQARLQASREAMERGHARTVSQVALDFGFSDLSHFSHAFRRAFGVCPQSLLQRR
ncbi:hypothetical protein ALO71_02943 [Pseudomonas amygdali pv. dendropanacis]|uniref:HTH araC/xylS-type domain-containing protein n=2 Tax=Pseudomonas amygdali TaxID=47877 RepID=A0A0P9PY95_PSEA0|nr:hypothetical protein ALO71_02943 [Pseudomonas amygdali pv. dendropanacis]